LREELVMRGPILVSSLLTLFVVAGVVLIAGSFLLQPAVPSAAASGNTEVIRRFYAAANETIATGDTTALRAVVAPHFVDQDPAPGMKPDRGGLEGYLAVLHAGVPDTELLVEAIVAGGDRAMARVAVRGGHGQTSLHGAVLDHPAPWGPVDVFRIADGMIAERWSHTDGTALVRPLAQTSPDLAVPAPRVVTIDRFTLAVGARLNAYATGPHLLYVEEGELSVHMREGRSGVPEPTPALLIAPLSVGQSLVMPAGATYDVTNVGTKATRVVVLSMTVPQAPGGAPVQSPLPPDVAGTRLAGGMAADVGIGPTVLTLEQMTLARGTQLSLSSAAGPILIAVDTGHLSMVNSEPAWIWSGADSINRRRQEANLAQGDGVLQSAGGVMMLRNVGDDPVVALVLTVRPVQASASVVAPGAAEGTV
jgi:mannose-6-phosphate isomerase-like protein (cupin superfamily)/ketosteroid isomerase-like protein